MFELFLLLLWLGLLIGGVVGIGLSLLVGWWGMWVILYMLLVLVLCEV